MPAHVPKPKKVDLKLRRDKDGWYVVEVRVDELGVQATQARTVRQALLNAAEVIYLMTEDA